MPFKFPASFSQEYASDVDDIDQAREIVQECVRDLAWQLEECEADRISALVKMNILSLGERVEIEFLPPKNLSITSRCRMPTQCFDWGKNERNISELIAKLQQNVAEKKSAGVLRQSSQSWGSPGGDRIESSTELVTEPSPERIQQRSVVYRRWRFELYQDGKSSFFSMTPSIATESTPKKELSRRKAKNKRRETTRQAVVVPLKNVSGILVSTGRDGNAGCGTAIACLLLSTTVVGLIVAVYLWQQASKKEDPHVTVFFDGPTGNREIDDFGIQIIELEDATAADTVYLLLKRNTPFEIQFHNESGTTFHRARTDDVELDEKLAGFEATKRSQAAARKRRNLAKQSRFQSPHEVQRDDEGRNWMCRIDDQEVGPVDRMAICKLFDAGTLKSSDSVRAVDSDDWRPASQFMDSIDATDENTDHDQLGVEQGNTVSNESHLNASNSQDVPADAEADDHVDALDTSDSEANDGPGSEADGGSDDTYSLAAVTDQVDRPIESSRIRSSGKSHENEGSNGADHQEQGSNSETAEARRSRNEFEQPEFRSDPLALIADCGMFVSQPGSLRLVLRMFPSWFIFHALSLFVGFLGFGMLLVTAETMPSLAKVPVVIIVAYGGPLVLVLLVILSYVAACCLEVYAQTGSGIRNIEEYPEGFDFGEWLRGFLTLSTCWLASLPAVMWAYNDPGIFSPTGLLACSVCSFFAFPIVAICFVVEPLLVVKSLAQHYKKWLSFYGFAFSLIVAFCVTYFVFQKLLTKGFLELINISVEAVGEWKTLAWVILLTPVLWAIGSSAFTLMSLAYSRLLGHLAHFLQWEYDRASEFENSKT